MYSGSRYWCTPIPGLDANVPLDAKDVASFATDGVVFVWVTEYQSVYPHTHVRLTAFDLDEGAVMWQWHDQTGLGGGSVVLACLPEPQGPDGLIYVLENERLVAIDLKRITN